MNIYIYIYIYINLKEDEHCIIIEQSLNSLQNLYGKDSFHKHSRTIEHRTCSNNWLKFQKSTRFRHKK